MNTPRRDWMKAFAWLGIVSASVLFWLAVGAAIVKIGGAW